MIFIYISNRIQTFLDIMLCLCHGRSDDGNFILDIPLFVIFVLLSLVVSALCVYTLQSNQMSGNRFSDEVTGKYLQDNKCWIRRNIVPWFVSPLSYDSDLTEVYNSHESQIIYLFQMCWLVRVRHWELLGKIYAPVKVAAFLTGVFFWLPWWHLQLPLFLTQAVLLKCASYTWSCHKAWKQTLFDVLLRVVAGTPRCDKICVWGILHPD